MSALWLEAKALIALGRVDEVNHLLEQSVHQAPDRGTTSGLVALRSGQELLAHGDSVATEKVFDRAVSWYQGLPESERSHQLSRYGEALYYAGKSRPATRHSTQPSRFRGRN